eukprot:NODE_411_length_7931_cov_0.531920.p9 type:complete len:100 gc:universal NODE_411_length_7931_cov_0.531920:1055-756(-)
MVLFIILIKIGRWTGLCSHKVARNCSLIGWKISPDNLSTKELLIGIWAFFAYRISSSIKLLSSLGSPVLFATIVAAVKRPSFVTSTSSTRYPFSIASNL